MYSLSSSESKYNVIFKLLEDIIQKLNFKEGEIHSFVKNLLNHWREDSSKNLEMQTRIISQIMRQNH